MKPKRFAIFLLIVIAFSLIAYYSSEENLESQEGKITRVIDGDTFILFANETEEKVRLSGINAPEKEEKFGQASANFLKTYEGSDIRVLFKERDKYGRILGYVFINGSLINEKILEQGLAHSYYYKPDKFTKKLLSAEAKAISYQINLWQKPESGCGQCIILEDFNKGGQDDCKPAGEKIVLKNSCNFDCSLEGWSIKDDATHLFWFDDFIFKADETLIVYNGKGKSQGNIFYFGNTAECASLWNDDHDTIFLRDGEGKLVLFKRY